jgi:dehydrogenase/reductase SDR family member 1
MSAQLVNKVALVTGATRGVGKGVALQLGQNGAKVYITGRTLKSKEGLPSLEQTANEIIKRGGQCVAIQCDHENDREVENLFKKIEIEQKGQLDILVNAAFKGGNTIFDNSDLKFWETDPVKTWDDINNVGLRNNYICSVYASRLMVPRKQGLIVNITSMGGQQYAFNAAYGIGKAGVDRMSHDCGIELRKFNVACLSLLLGGVRTEFSEQMIHERGDKAVLKLDPNNPFLNQIKLSDVIGDAESPEFAGKCISYLANDPKLMSYSSKILIAAEYAQAKSIRDIDGRVVPSHRQINSAMKLVLPKQLHFVSNFIPNFVKVPQFAFDLMSSKF